MPNEKTDMEFSQLLHPVRTRRASEVIYQQIKELILCGKLKPGDRLPSERALIDLFSRSRPTIREALRMLERDGFICTVPGGSGAIIQLPSANMVTQSLDAMLQIGQVSKEELGEYRIHNDAAVARWAARRRTAADLEEMEAVLAEAGEAIQARNWELFMDHDPKFHVRLAQAGKNEVAAIMSQVLGELSVPIALRSLLELSPEEALLRAQSILDMHRNILTAVARGDAQVAEEAMTFHIRRFIRDNQ